MGGKSGECRIIAYTEETLPRKRACINCGRRDLWGAGSRCGYDGHYIGYLDTWDDWCRHWTKTAKSESAIRPEPSAQSADLNKSAPGETGVYGEEIGK